MFLPHGNTPHPDYVGGIIGTQNNTIQQAAANDDLAKVSICDDSSTMVRLLLFRGADNSLRDGWDPDWPDSFTAVENAARLSARATMQELLAHGVNVEDSNAVYFAASESDAEMLKLLFDNT
ncbi:hypothetical protein SNOG_04959 [Parastagonospora nodorum SN15]|uniref:Uncharacterized protein n=1 Tax=Phaeosphaeria nodorum (strain SN15 / ATCC MYA-4574 / FGSC 10173) TaxID=321614 RepID=Q0UTF5_PHANO|nr:hypothetical protein SNOG_04959 [Parastagonospora nodorum SN15]EAT87350.1 hypothetical protein SNOG_04959 [Parastagonospora nodorum SN15]